MTGPDDAELLRRTAAGGRADFDEVVAWHRRRPGPLYAHFVVPISLALLFAVVGVVVIVASR